MTATIEIQGMEELQRKLNRLENVGAVLTPPVRNAANLVRAEMATYPAETAANHPHGTKPDRWYKRGTGTVYVTAAGQQRTYKTSQRLRQSWSIAFTFTRHMAQAIIGTVASYALYVHWQGKQAWFHTARGWRTAQQVVKALQPRIMAEIKQAVDTALAGR